MADKEASFRIELALRAGQLAKTALELTTASGSGIARIMLADVARNLRDLDKFIEKAHDEAGR